MTSVAPAVGPVGGGQLVTLAGTGFASGATVVFGGAAAPAIAARGSAVVVSHLMTGPAPQSGTQTRTNVQWSADSGATWSGAVGLGTVIATPGSPPFFQAVNALDVPSVGVDGQGTFTAVWVETSQTTSSADVFVSWSTDGGQTWAAPTSPANVSKNGGASRTPQVAGRPGSGAGALAVFADDTATTGAPDVLVR